MHSCLQHFCEYSCEGAKGKRTLVVTDDREPERGVDVEVIWIEEKRVVPRVDSVEGEKRVDKKMNTQSRLMQCNASAHAHACYIYHMIVM